MLHPDGFNGEQGNRGEKLALRAVRKEMGRGWRMEDRFEPETIAVIEAAREVVQKVNQKEITLLISKLSAALKKFDEEFDYPAQDV